MSSIQIRLKKLEDIVAKHLMESGAIQTNLSWNTRITSGIAIAVIAKIVIDFLKH